VALNWTNLQNAVYAAVNGAVAGVTVVWAPQAGTFPMPAKPFVTLRLISTDNAQGAVSGTMDELRSTADPLVWQFVHQRRHVLSVNAYSNATQQDGSAFDILSKINRRLQLASVQAALLAAGLRLWQTSAVRDLSAMLDTRGEGRAQCDYALATQDTTADAIGYIETVDLTDVDVEAP
jgi:hypothetical protein